jgi:hypothetical protein
VSFHFLLLRALRGEKKTSLRLWILVCFCCNVCSNASIVCSSRHQQRRALSDTFLLSSEMVGTGQTICQIGRLNIQFSVFVVCFIAFFVSICDANRKNSAESLAYPVSDDRKLNFRQLFNRKSIFRDIHFQYYDRLVRVWNFGNLCFGE